MKQKVTNGSSFRWNLGLSLLSFCGQTVWTDFDRTLNFLCTGKDISTYKHLPESRNTMQWKFFRLPPIEPSFLHNDESVILTAIICRTVWQQALHRSSWLATHLLILVRNDSIMRSFMASGERQCIPCSMKCPWSGMASKLLWISRLWRVPRARLRHPYTSRRTPWSACNWEDANPPDWSDVRTENKLELRKAIVFWAINLKWIWFLGACN